MNDVLNEIAVLKNAIIAFCEGASVEKHMELISLTKLIEEKEAIVEQFEQENCDYTTKAI